VKPVTGKLSIGNWKGELKREKDPVKLSCTGTRGMTRAVLDELDERALI
jgi:hypothetical protein